MAQNNPDDAYEGQAHLVVDACGLNCPLPVLKLRKRLRDVAVGQIVELRATDRAALKDVPNFCEAQGHTLLATTGAESVHVFLVQRSI